MPFCFLSALQNNTSSARVCCVHYSTGCTVQLHSSVTRTAVCSQEKKKKKSSGICYFFPVVSNLYRTMSSVYSYTPNTHTHTLSC